MKTRLLLACMLLCCLQLLAQQRAIKGVVTDEKGVPLIGATIVPTGQKGGVTTQSDGSFNLMVNAETKQLTVSFVSYITREIILSNQSVYQIRLTEDTRKLDEVVITAYGSTQKKSFTGSAAVIKADQIKDLQVSNVTSVLQGTASGVMAIGSTGQPGEDMTIRIRGIGSYNASASPIYVVDGAIFGGSLSNINPNDIESITVLKDASSAAMYGSTAANGVILITTKMGKGKAKFNFTNVSGFSNRAVKEYKLLNQQQFMELTWEALKNDAIAAGNADPAQYATDMLVGRIDEYNPYNDPKPVGTDGKLKAGLTPRWDDNWMNALTRTGKRNESTLSVSGGNPDGIRYFLSGGYLSDQGRVIESNFKRYSTRLKVDSKINKWLSAGGNISLSYSTQNYPYQGDASASNALAFARTVAPIYPIYLRDENTGEIALDASGNKVFDYGLNGPWKRSYNPGQNPAATVAQNPITNDVFTTSGNFFGEAILLPGLKFRTQYAVDYYNYVGDVFWNPFYGDGSTTNGLSYRGLTTSFTTTFTNTLTYDKLFGKDHHINLLAGTEARGYNSSQTWAQSTGFTFDKPTQINYGSTFTAGGYKDANRVVSYMGRAMYDFRDKYHLSLSIRNDADSRFAEKVRNGVFYSAGVAWNINKEFFLAGADYLSELKLKASYGTTGNSNILINGSPSYFPYLPTYTSGANMGPDAGSTIKSVGNDQLTWEKQEQLDLGIEYGFFDNRLYGSIVYYNRKSRSLIFNRPLPNSTGNSSVISNIGKVSNAGIEFEISSVNIKRKDFEWTTSLNISRNKNKVLDVPLGTTFIVGKSLYEFRLKEYAGVNPENGTPMWYKLTTDANGKTTKDTTSKYADATLQYVGGKLPDYTGGLTNTIRYKSFDLSVLVYFVGGGHMYATDYASLMHSFYSAGTNASAELLSKRWQSKTNPGDGLTPKLMATTDLNTSSSSTRFMYDATYMRVRNITLGYRVPANILQRTFIGGARVYADVQNPFTWFGGPKGTDPEAGISAVASGHNSTALRTVSVGVNLDF
ncbi:TonB-dependent receptor [Chitinophaga sp. Cy-1792]|uniref:SusC/RagA family TonB-linked outer membrane protein n=1 Tax=Chitinophaga sp. Cy-1792 TaxID=2608339 RepID=UPI001423D204|nr:TonB-dependent receptor [Chitinophaga sp. Cy-1792]NIG52051.1 TonB-dependent receptor [Chitinophaga sp. Cy-1792]